MIILHIFKKNTVFNSKYERNRHLDFRSSPSPDRDHQKRIEGSSSDVSSQKISLEQYINIFGQKSDQQAHTSEASSSGSNRWSTIQEGILGENPHKKELVKPDAKVISDDTEDPILKGLKERKDNFRKKIKALLDENQKLQSEKQTLLHVKQDLQNEKQTLLRVNQDLTNKLNQTYQENQNLEKIIRELAQYLSQVLLDKAIIPEIIQTISNPKERFRLRCEAIKAMAASNYANEDLLDKLDKIAFNPK